MWVQERAWLRRRESIRLASTGPGLRGRPGHDATRVSADVGHSAAMDRRTALDAWWPALGAVAASVALTPGPRRPRSGSGYLALAITPPLDNLVTQI